MHINPVGMYAACAVAWSFIETNLEIARLDRNDKHWLNRAIRAVRDWSKNQSPAVSVGARMLCCFGLAILAWIPVLIYSAVWPLTVLIYVVVNARGDE
ncbi:hypothetical protein H8U31_001369 [Salmonella enterica]|nr:hypothetical protein [Salmonella enterica]EFO7976549.1 hypothetical protein [Salmonella enterica]EGC0267618.1 hypothetical protein [Salmonella enterica]